MPYGKVRVRVSPRVRVRLGSGLAHQLLERLPDACSALGRGLDEHHRLVRVRVRVRARVRVRVRVRVRNRVRVRVGARASCVAATEIEHGSAGRWPVRLEKTRGSGVSLPAEG